MRILLWAVFISASCGTVGLGEPLDDLVRGLRDAVRAQNASGEVVVVAVDDLTNTKLGGPDYPRRYEAKVVENLFKLGAKRVFFDNVYSKSSTKFDDAQFAASLSRFRGRVFLGSLSLPDPLTMERTSYVPTEPLRSKVRLASLDLATISLGLSHKLPYNTPTGGKLVPSLSNVVSNKNNDSDEFYRPDWSIKVSSIPTVRLFDVYNNNVHIDKIRGKDIIIGYTSVADNDIKFQLSNGYFGGVYIHAIGSETLLKGTPVEFNWIYAYLVSILLSVLLLYANSNTVSYSTVPISFFALGLTPLFLDQFLIGVDIGAGLIMFLIASISGLPERRIANSALINVSTGLPNIAALRKEGSVVQQTLIALKIRNYSEISASFVESIEREFFVELCRRIGVTSNEGSIFHSEDTLFWFSDIPMGANLTNHLQGLNALASSAILISSRMIDVQIAFGIDGDFDRPLSSRIGSASLCAQEASEGNDIWKFYDPERQHEAAWQLSLIGQLEKAIDNNEIWVAFQPKLDLTWNRIVGAEALVRWTHPERGTVGPDEFIIAAETHNRIEKLTAFVLDRALAATNEIHYVYPNFSIAVNLSAQLLESPVLLDLIQQALKKNRFPPDKLVLEITETAHLTRSTIALDVMTQIRAMGIHLSVDDYGTGNATMDYLKLLPSDEVKIDRSFVSGICSDAQDRIMVQSTIKMVHDLGRRVVAEGVETQDVMDQLRALGCDMVQGYLVGKPVPLGVFIRQLPEAPQRLAG